MLNLVQHLDFGILRDPETILKQGQDRVEGDNSKKFRNFKYV